MYRVTLTKNRKEVLYHSEEVDMQVALIFLLGYKALDDKTLNVHIDKYKDGKIDESFLISELNQ